ncbi:hypothetical protein [Bittarella massiliensis (ex Durand et al. 2017)]|uniref:hypothetical protein n=1 Tax=Bittarella massiliensis (ex Durand et al. 2017) TaxID=1720313 RepID=UPI00073EAB21|nr:hypothetical protein [Bittarella massiliensis (ex Durand et al. 2017)]
MHFDASITITSIIAVCAIISPIATSLINNHHQKTMRKVELEYEIQRNLEKHKKVIFEDFIRAAGACIYYSDGDALKEIGKHIYVVLCYAPEELVGDIKTLENQIRGSNFEEASENLKMLSVNLRQIM